MGQPLCVSLHPVSPERFVDCIILCRVNMGTGRHIPMQQKEGIEIKIHRTVKIRMEADGLLGGKYWPKAKLKVEPQWVD
jgi:hypothetical protein